MLDEGSKGSTCMMENSITEQISSCTWMMLSVQIIQDLEVSHCWIRKARAKIFFTFSWKFLNFGDLFFTFALCCSSYTFLVFPHGDVWNTVKVRDSFSPQVSIHLQCIMFPYSCVSTHLCFLTLRVLEKASWEVKCLNFTSPTPFLKHGLSTLF